MNKNQNLKSIKNLNVGERFRLQGDKRPNIPVMTVESRTSADGRTVLVVALPGGARQRFHRPSLTVVEVVA